jgi:large subunit ribosomal protein L22
MEVEAKARYMRIPPRKARLVAATVIGMPVKDALVVLGFTPKAAAHEIGKVVKSAAANATNNFSQDEDALVVKRIVVDEGPTLKRGRPRARGMYASIFKRTSHITAVVEASELQARPTRRRAAAATAPAQPAKPKAEKTKAEETKADETKADETTAEAATAEEAKVEEVAETAEDQRAVDAEVEAEPVTPDEVVAVADAPAEAADDTPAEAPAASETPKSETVTKENA